RRRRRPRDPRVLAAMPRPFVLPDLGEGLTEAEIVKVLVQEGDRVQEDAPLLEVETDKATVEIPSPVTGRVAKIHVQPGQTVKVGAVLVTFDEEAGRGGAASLGTTLARSAPPADHTTSATQRAPAATAAAATRGSGPVAATPATRRLARELGVDIHTVRGTGHGGRVSDDDVRAAAGGRPPASAQPAAQPVAPERPATRKPLAPVGAEAPALPRFEQWGAVERQPLSHLRRTIAERMTLSATLVPHVTHFDRADITELDAIIRRNVEPARRDLHGDQHRGARRDGRRPDHQLPGGRHPRRRARAGGAGCAGRPHRPPRPAAALAHVRPPRRRRCRRRPLRRRHRTATGAP